MRSAKPPFHLGRRDTNMEFILYIIYTKGICFCSLYLIIKNILIPLHNLIYSWLVLLSYYSFWQVSISKLQFLVPKVEIDILQPSPLLISSAQYCLFRSFQMHLLKLIFIYLYNSHFARLWMKISQPTYLPYRNNLNTGIYSNFYLRLFADVVRV